MAVDYIHRIVVSGPHASVDLFRRQLRLVTSRTVAGHTWRERVPFSFERLYELAPGAARIEPEVPCDPYDMSVWPIRRLPRGAAEIRYALHTRNMELLPFVRALSRKFASLRFCLVTFCLDGNEIASYLLCDGCLRRWVLPPAREEAHWERARQEFGIAGDDLYEDDVARYSAEDGMLEEALDHWEPSAPRPQRVKRSGRSWSNREISRDMKSERLIAIAQIQEELRADERAADVRRVRRSSRKRSRRARK